MNEIGLEDIFLGAELLYVNAINDDERNMVNTAINDYLQPLLLDAIYDNDTVNDIYKMFPDSFINYLKRYDAIFTLNYGNRQIIMRSDIKLPQPFASWSNSL